MLENSVDGDVINYTDGSVIGHVLSYWAFIAQIHRRDQRRQKKFKGTEDQLHCNGSPQNAQYPSAELHAVECS
jgi:hypothetical protein